MLLLDHFRSINHNFYSVQINTKKLCISFQNVNSCIPKGFKIFLNQGVLCYLCWRIQHNRNDTSKKLLTNFNPNCDSKLQTTWMLCHLMLYNGKEVRYKTIRHWFCRGLVFIHSFRFLSDACQYIHEIVKRFVAKKINRYVIT